MAVVSRCLAALVVSLSGALPLAATAAADPVDSGETADVVIAGLKAEGYNVVINWLTGFDTVPLSRCIVQNINNPDSSAPKPGAFTTVYVDVACSNHQDD